MECAIGAGAGGQAQHTVRLGQDLGGNQTCRGTAHFNIVLGADDPHVQNFYLGIFMLVDCFRENF